MPTCGRRACRRSGCEAITPSNVWVRAVHLELTDRGSLSTSHGLRKSTTQRSQRQHAEAGAHCLEAAETDSQKDAPAKTKYVKHIYMYMYVQSDACVWYVHSKCVIN